MQGAPRCFGSRMISRQRDSPLRFCDVSPRRESARDLQGRQCRRSSLQVRVELQADCLAGVWANRAEEKWQFIERGDVESALQAASAIGDDRLQRRSQGYVVPDAFTHGSSAQRTRWFTIGLKSGNVNSVLKSFDWSITQDKVQPTRRFCCDWADAGRKYARGYGAAEPHWDDITRAQLMFRSL